MGTENGKPQGEAYRPVLGPFIAAMARHCRLLAEQGRPMEPKALIEMADDMETAAALGGRMEQRLHLIDEAARQSQKRLQQMQAMAERHRQGGKVQ